MRCCLTAEIVLRISGSGNFFGGLLVLGSEYEGGLRQCSAVPRRRGLLLARGVPPAMMGWALQPQSWVLLTSKVFATELKHMPWFVME
jgi:hypothetical protein